MSKKILVTGGAGFIGSHVCDRLVTDGYRVVVVDRKELERKDLKSYKIDIRNEKRLKKVFDKERPSQVIHLAAEAGVRESFKRGAEYIETNVNGTFNVLMAAKNSGAKQVVYSSSSSVYGKRTGTKGFLETDRMEPVSPYAVSKVAAEHVCRIFSGNNKLPITVLRFFTVYGPRNRTDMAAYKFMKAIDEGKQISIYGKGTKRDFTYVGDIVLGVKMALKRTRAYEEINLGSGKPVLVAALIKEVERVLGKKAKLKRVALPQGDVPVTFANINKAKKLLGWRPKVSIKVGIKNLVGWYNAAYD